MIDDASTLASGDPIETDVCIVGAGPAGIALARELAQRHVDVVLVESGALRIDAAAQQLNEAVVSGLEFVGHTDGRSRAFGGSTRLWAGQCLPLDPIDFEARPWVAHSGWPVSHADLVQYWRRAERFFDVEGECYDARIYHRFGLEAPEWSPESLEAMFTVYTPTVDTGAACERDLRRAEGVRVLLNATVTEILSDPSGRRAEGVDLRTAAGGRRQIRARRTVLCAGGLENARLLLLSRSAQPNGLGNDNDLVGRFLQDHPNGLTASLAGDGAHLQERFRLLYAAGKRYFPKMKLSQAAQRRHHVLNANAHLVFDYLEDNGLNDLRAVVRSVRNRDFGRATMLRALSLPRHAGQIAGVLKQRMRGRSPIAKPTAVHLQCYLEQEPNPESRIALHPDRRDRFDAPMLDIRWATGALESRTLQKITDAVSSEFARLGLGRLERLPWMREETPQFQRHFRDGYHHAGTTRMAETPARGVVDTDCQVFGVEGLYVCGGSVFPTSGYANPTLTIVALATRLGEHLAARRA